MLFECVKKNQETFENNSALGRSAALGKTGCRVSSHRLDNVISVIYTTSFLNNATVIITAFISPSLQY